MAVPLVPLCSQLIHPLHQQVESWPPTRQSQIEMPGWQANCTKLITFMDAADQHNDCALYKAQLLVPDATVTLDAGSLRV